MMSRSSPSPCTAAATIRHPAPPRRGGRRRRQTGARRRRDHHHRRAEAHHPRLDRSRQARRPQPQPRRDRPRPPAGQPPVPRRRDRPLATPQVLIESGAFLHSAEEAGRHRARRLRRQTGLPPRRRRLSDGADDPDDYVLFRHGAASGKIWRRGERRHHHGRQAPRHQRDLPRRPGPRQKSMRSRATSSPPTSASPSPATTARPPPRSPTSCSSTWASPCSASRS